MCLIVFKWQPNAKQILTLASNRDEFYARPSQTAHFWDNKPHIFGGRDLEMNGTWLAVSRNMRFAAVTNFRSPNNQTFARSRGEIPASFLSSNQSAAHFAQHIQKDAFAGFNALLFDGENLVYCHNNKNSAGEYDEAISLSAGEYGLSNHLLNTPWPKVQRTKEALQGISTLQNKSDISQYLLTALQNKEFAPDNQLPDTGIGLEFERLLSPSFITSESYGTRTSTIIIIEQKIELTSNNARSSPKIKEIYFHERQHQTNNQELEDKTYTITPI
jgi:uncharacterized protein with NRDE domain